MTKVAQVPGVTAPETVRMWVRQAQVDEGVRAGTITADSAELKRENVELRHANSILEAASAVFTAEQGRPSH